MRTKDRTGDDILFDAPGPRGRARIRTASIAAALLLAAVAAAMLARLGASGQLDPDRWAMLTDGAMLRFLLQGLGMTLLVGLLSTALSVAAGVLLALGRIGRRRWLSLPCAAVIEFFRAMPLLLILFFVMFGLPEAGVRIPMLWQLVLAVTAHAGAVFAEIVRAGIGAVPRGQREAGEAVGLRHRQVMALIVLPQAARALLPALITQMVRVVKESSLGYVVGIAELLNNGKVLAEYSGDFIQAYIGAAVLYILVNIALSRLAERLAGGRAPRRNPESA